MNRYQQTAALDGSSYQAIEGKSWYENTELMANELVDPNKNFGHIIRFVYAKQLLELMRWSLESSLFNRRLLRRFINKKKHVKTSLSNFNEPFYRREIITFMCITGLVCLPFIDVAFAEIKPSCKSKKYITLWTLRAHL